MKKKNHLKVELHLDGTDAQVMEYGVDVFRRHLIQRIIKAFEKEKRILTVDELAFLTHTPPEQLLTDIEILERELKQSLKVIGARQHGED